MIDVVIRREDAAHYAEALNTVLEQFITLQSDPALALRILELRNVLSASNPTRPNNRHICGGKINVTGNDFHVCEGCNAYQFVGDEPFPTGVDAVANVAAWRVNRSRSPG